MDEMFSRGRGAVCGPGRGEAGRARPGRQLSGALRGGSPEGSGLQGAALALPAVPALAPGPWEACGRRRGCGERRCAPPGGTRMWAPLWRACCRAAGASARREAGRRGPGRRRGSGEAGARQPGGAGPPVGAVRSIPCPARRFCLPRSWGPTGAPCGAGAPRSPSVQASPQGTASVSLSYSPGRGDSPREIATATEGHSSPQCVGGWRCRLLEAPGLRNWPGKALGVQLTAARCRRPCWVGWGREGVWGRHGHTGATLRARPLGA